MHRLQSDMEACDDTAVYARGAGRGAKDIYIYINTYIHIYIYIYIYREREMEIETWRGEGQKVAPSSRGGRRRVSTAAFERGGNTFKRVNVL